MSGPELQHTGRQDGLLERCGDQVAVLVPKLVGLVEKEVPGVWREQGHGGDLPAAEWRLYGE